MYSEHLVPTPILKSSPSQLSHFVRKITNAWHALQNNPCPKSPQKGETKRNFNQPKHKAFSVSPSFPKRGARHKGQFQLVQSTVDELELNQDQVLWIYTNQKWGALLLNSASCIVWHGCKTLPLKLSATNRRLRKRWRTRGGLTFM